MASGLSHHESNVSITTLEHLLDDIENETKADVSSTGSIARQHFQPSSIRQQGKLIREISSSLDANFSQVEPCYF